MELQMENGTVYENPGAQTIEQALKTLDEENSFAIRARSDLTYMQVSRVDENSYHLEHQDGAVEKHYEAGADVTLQRLTDAFKSYAADGPEWRTQFDWKPMDLSTSGRSGCAGVVVAAVLLCIGAGLAAVG